MMTELLQLLFLSSVVVVAAAAVVTVVLPLLLLAPCLLLNEQRTKFCKACYHSVQNAVLSHLISINLQLG
jgi:hypothetical protein